MRYVIAKVVDNDNGYQYPSGGKYNERDERRKQRNPDLTIPYSRTNGFGHEEWNFNKAFAVNGKIRGYHYYRPGKNKRDDLFTIYFVSYRERRWRLKQVDSTT